jgi:hypothetical protein
MNRKLNSNSDELGYGLYRLANKKTGRLASNTNWLLDLAAMASIQSHTTGIGSLLPIREANKLLVHNKLEAFRKQNLEPSEEHASSHDDLRRLAQRALPAIAAFYSQRVIPEKKSTSVNRKGFVAWIVQELANRQSGLNLYLLESEDFKALAETQRKERWWLDQLKMQSK